MKKVRVVSVFVGLALAVSALAFLPAVHAGHIIVIQRPPGTPTPIPTSPTLPKLRPGWMPGVLEIEDFDGTGEGRAYHDVETANLGGAYRLTESVDIAASPDGGHYVTSAVAGEWLSYNVRALQGTYVIQVRVASAGP